MMKFVAPVFLLLATLAVVACSGPAAEENMIPEDLEGKKALLKEKRAALLKLSEEITLLESQLENLDPQSLEKRARLVVTAPVTRKDFIHYVDIQGSIVADDLIDVSAEAGGRILKLVVKEGDAVKAGQLVAELDMESLEKQKAEIQKALELAATVYERQKRLWEQNIGSEIQFLEAKNAKERLEKSLETLDVQMTKSKVYAPASGVVEREILQSGEMAAPGAPIVQLLNTQKLKVVVDIPENFLAAVRKGDEVQVQFPALGTDQRVRVSQIGRVVDPSNRTFEVEALVQNPTGFLKPNLLAIMKINDFSSKDQVVIPLKAVLQEVGGKKYVMVAVAQGDSWVAQKKYVSPGETFGGEVIIAEGLTGGESLVLEGARGLLDGEQIQPEAAEATPVN
jgi:RND family efflux transporter MFP subunit